MNVAAALALACLQSPGIEEAAGLEIFARARAGAWISSRFAVDATLSSGARRETDGWTLFSAGLDAGVTVSDTVVLFGTYEGSLTDDIDVEVGGLAAGWRERGGPGLPPWMPSDVQAYVGGLWGRFDVREDGFGTFDEALGVRVGTSLAWSLLSRLSATLVVDYRYMEWDYNEPTVGGRDSAGGSGFWFGAGLELRF